MRYRRLTKSEREERYISKRIVWHEWFAWYPVRMTSDVHEVRWMETIWRKGTQWRNEDGLVFTWKYAESSLDILKINPDDAP